MEQVQDELVTEPVISVLPLAQAASAIMTVRDLDAAEIQALGYGQRLSPKGPKGPAQNFAGISPDGELIAILADDGSKARPVLVFAPAQ